jgi:hypothetical protein
LGSWYQGEKSFFCRVCGKPFKGKGPGKWSYCSKECRTRNNTAQHARYVSKNRQHVNAYARERKLTIRGRSNRKIAIKAQRLAAHKILPLLGFSEIYHVSSVHWSFPFDIIATYHGERILLDVTTRTEKSIIRQKKIAGALRMRFLILFVKPDPMTYYLSTEVESNYVKFRESELREIA